MRRTKRRKKGRKEERKKGRIIQMCANISRVASIFASKLLALKRQKKREKERSPALFAHNIGALDTLNALIPVCLQL